MSRRVENAAVVRPMFGERVSGDAVFVAEFEGIVFAAVIDVLGHGDEAHALATRIHAYLADAAGMNPGDVLSRVHHHCRGSRGAAIGVCSIEITTGQLRFAGVGNVVFRRFGAVETRLVSRDGVVGGTMPTPVEEALKLSVGDTVVLYTDGVSANFESSAYDRLLVDAPRSVAATIVHRFGKSHDDAACAVLRYLG